MALKDDYDEPLTAAQHRQATLFFTAIIVIALVLIWLLSYLAYDMWRMFCSPSGYYPKT